MKISVNIELSNVEELNQIAEAFKANGIEVGDLEASTTVKDTAAPKAAPAKPKKGKAAKAEVEEMEDVPSPFVATPAPAQPLVGSAQAIPPVINQAPAQQYAPQAPVMNQAPVQAPQQQYAPQAQQAPQYAQGINPSAMIQDAAGRLGAFPGMSPAQKQDLIAATLQQVGAPQGIKGSELPEPHLSRFAQALQQRVDQVTAPQMGGLV